MYSRLVAGCKNRIDVRVWVGVGLGLGLELCDVTNLLVSLLMPSLCNDIRSKNANEKKEAQEAKEIAPLPHPEGIPGVASANKINQS